MKRFFPTILLMSFFICNSDIFAYETCNPANPFVPCTYSSVDFDSYIGNENQGAVFFIYSAMTALTEFTEYYYINVLNGSSLINFGYSSGWIDYGFYNGGMAYKSPFYGITGFQMLGGVAPNPINLNITRSPKLGGGVSDYPTGENILCGINSYEICEAPFPLNTQVTLDAYPNEGYAFKHWIINNVISSDTDGSIDIVMSETKNVEAVYVRIRYPVDYTPENPNGWSHNKQSFGSLNNTGGVPHAAEDWNKTTGGCTDAGEPLYSIANGTVTDITSGNSTDGWGKTILIQHNAPAGSYFLTGTGQMFSTMYSLYAHMLKARQYEDQYSQDIYDSTMDIQQTENNAIEIGDPVGQVGDGDGQWACHLHFAILTNANLVSTYRNQDPYDWGALSNFTDPSELINNGLYSEQSTSFTIVVHPYECNNTFRLDSTTPNCNGSSSTIGNWTRRGDNYNSENTELGYNGIIYSKPANATGTASWTPGLPRNGQYRVWVYIPNSTTYASSESAEYMVTSNSVCYDPFVVNQSANHGSWVNIGTYNLYQGDTTVSLDGDTDEVDKVIAIDAVKFEYVGPIQ